MTTIGEVGTAEGVAVALDRGGAEGRKVKSSESLKYEEITNLYNVAYQLYVK